MDPKHIRSDGSDTASTPTVKKLVPAVLRPIPAFRSFLDDGQLPLFDRSGGNRIVAKMIGENPALGLLYTLKVVLCRSSDRMLWDGQTSWELIFYVTALSTTDPDLEPLVFYSGAHTKPHFADRTFRGRVANLMVNAVRQLVQDAKPDRLFFVPKHPDMPPAAELKYHKIAAVMSDLGYKFDAGAVDAAAKKVSPAWYFVRA